MLLRELSAIKRHQNLRKKNYSAIAVLKYFTTFKRQFKIQLDDSLKYS